MKRRLNIQALISLLVIVIGFIIIVNDLIKIANGYSYTVMGVISLIFLLLIMSESFKYIEDRLKGDR